METVRLLVCIALAVPCGALIARVSDGFISERPLFQPSESPKVSPRTLAIVVVTMVSFVLVAWRFSEGTWFELLAYLAGFGALLLASVIDITEYRLPDAVVIPSLSVGLLLVIVGSIVDQSPERMQFAFAGGLLAFGVLLVAHVISPQGMGFGDVKFAALLGVMVGWQASSFVDVVLLVLWLLLIGFAFGAVGGVALMVLRGRNRPFPFGPFLALGTLLTVVLSRALVG